MSKAHLPESFFSSVSASERKLFSVLGEVSTWDAGVSPAYVVGGYVRDLLLSRPCTDIDIVTEGSGLALARKVASALGVKRVVEYSRFRTAMFRYRDLQVEFVGARRESYSSDSRKPVVEAASLSEDLARRDFTMNALAIELHPDGGGVLIDEFGGVQDLHAGLIRTPVDPKVTFNDDPLRMMRAVRFASQLGFRLDETVVSAILALHDRLEIVSMERIVAEFNKIMLSPKPSVGLSLLGETGLLGHILPELLALRGVENVEGIGHKDNFAHTLQVVDNVASTCGDLGLRWGALLHDIGKARTKRFHRGQGWTFHAHEYVGSRMVPRIFRRLRLPQNAQMRRVEKLVALHMRPIVLSEDIVTDSAVRRLLFDAGDEIESLMQLCEADITTKNPNRAARYLRNFAIVREKLKDLEERDRIRNFQPPIDGDVIMRVYNLTPSREVGVIKSAIKDAILDGEIGNDPVEAIGVMMSTGAELGLTPVMGAHEVEALAVEHFAALEEMRRRAHEGVEMENEEPSDAVSQNSTRTSKRRAISGLEAISSEEDRDSGSGRRRSRRMGTPRLGESGLSVAGRAASRGAEEE